MPIYEYKCNLCNEIWEEIQKFSDDPLTVCKSCEKEGGVHKLLSARISFGRKGGGRQENKVMVPVETSSMSVNADGKIEDEKHWHAEG